MKNQLIGKIESGVVVDHIPKGIVWKVAEILQADTRATRTSLADGCESRRMSSGKGILKIEGYIPTDYELNLIALVAPNATVNTISHGKVSAKKRVEIPSMLEGIIGCPNSGCISFKVEGGVKPKIYYHGESTGEGTFSCHYCSYSFSRDEVKI